MLEVVPETLSRATKGMGVLTARVTTNISWSFDEDEGQVLFGRID